MQIEVLFKKKTKQNRMANSVDPDEKARYKPSHLDLHCLQRYMFWSVWLKELRGHDTLSGNKTEN